MDTDLILVIGTVICVLAIPSLLSAYSSNRSPRGAAIMILIGGVLVVVALTQHKAGYSFAEMPEVFLDVLARLR